jgi:hypothetical protein
MNLVDGFIRHYNELVCVNCVCFQDEEECRVGRLVEKVDLPKAHYRLSGIWLFEEKHNRDSRRYGSITDMVNVMTVNGGREVEVVPRSEWRKEW